MTAQNQFDQEQHVETTSLNKQMTASTAGQQNSSASLRPQPALRRVANILAMQDGGGSVGPSGTPATCNYGNRKLQQQDTKKTKKIHSSLEQFNLMGSISLQSELTANTMEENPSGSTKAGSSRVWCARCF